MASLFILDVPEFSPLVESAANNGADVTRQGDYQVISQMTASSSNVPKPVCTRRSGSAR